ncbi:uncharacterized protein [Watersipora subatra]|uniref:uncharacterized protein n=1 Tax=Watersipora subatra TaxID=2589382 RepID=UPI00355C8663
MKNRSSSKSSSSSTSKALHGFTKVNSAFSVSSKKPQKKPSTPKKSDEADQSMPSCSGSTGNDEPTSTSKLPSTSGYVASKTSMLGTLTNSSTSTGKSNHSLKSRITSVEDSPKISNLSSPTAAGNSMKSSAGTRSTADGHLVPAARSLRNVNHLGSFSGIPSNLLGRPPVNKVPINDLRLASRSEGNISERPRSLHSITELKRGVPNSKPSHVSTSDGDNLHTGCGSSSSSKIPASFYVSPRPQRSYSYAGTNVANPELCPFTRHNSLNNAYDSDETDEDVLQVMLEEPYSASQPRRTATRLRYIKGHHSIWSSASEDLHKKQVTFQLPSTPNQKGLSGRRRQGLTRRAHHQRSKHARSSKHKGTKPSGARTGGAKSGRRMDHYHMRRRYLHAGLAGAGVGAGMMYGLDGNGLLDDDPFAEDTDFLDDMDMAEIMGESESEENESVGHEAEEEVDMPDGVPPLQSDEHCHAFIYHSSNADDQDLVEHYVSTIENSPHDLKVMTNERDFKADLSNTSNLLLAITLSQRIVLVCSQEFVENELPQFESVAYGVMSEEDRKNRLLVLLLPDAELPASLSRLPKIFHSIDTDCYDRLTKILSSGPVNKDNMAVQPSAPPAEKGDFRGVSPFSKEHSSSQKTSSDSQAIITKEPSNYPNGAVIRRITARKYKSFELERGTPPSILDTYCPCTSLCCPQQDPVYRAPSALTRRGLQITDAEFESILKSLTEASKVSFFQKAVDCSLPTLFLSVMAVTAAVTFSLWFLVTGALHHHSSEDADLSGSIFWSFMILVFFLPTLVALVMLAVLIHLVNYKYLKYRIKTEELNKRFRETNLVLHCQRAYWSCSSRIRLYFIYYNFELCQQTLYCHVHDNMTRVNGPLTAQTNFLGNGDSATLKLDKIMKRVNTLTKKFEWDYFEALTRHKLPNVEEKEHREKGMCFCQYVLHREFEEPQLSVVEAVKYRFSSAKRNAFRKSHRRKSQGSRVYLAPYRNNNGLAHFV